MVGFGKSIVKARREGWKEAYLNYDNLKEIVKVIDVEVTELKLADGFAFKKSLRSLELTHSLDQGGRLETAKEAFLSALKLEVEKLSLFILQQQGRLADAVGALRFDSDLFDKNNPLLPQNLDNNTLDQYAALGVELLHLLKFVCVNSIGVRKILKKYNKCLEQLDEPIRYEVDGNHLQQLAYSSSIQAIESSLHSALEQFLVTIRDHDNAVSISQIHRFQCVMMCNDRLRRNAEILQQPFWDFLSRKAMILTGTNLGGMEGSGKKALTWLIRLRPQNLLTMSQVELETVWTRWSGGPTVTNVTELNRVPSSQKRLLQSIREEEFPTDQEVLLDDWRWGGVNSASMTLNLLSTLLYTINYYIVAPTANHYAIKLGADGAFGSTLIGASSFSALFAAFFYSFWYTKASFKSALLFSSLCPVVGNLLYALAISYASMPLAIFGRILCGFGSAEVVNRQLISACVNFEGMTKASALFVAASAIGMSIGPLIAGILEISTGRDMDVDLKLPFLPAGGLIYDHVTSPGFVMAGLWMLEFVALAFLFTEPRRINAGQENVTSSSRSFVASERGTDTQKPLLVVNDGHYGSIHTFKNQHKAKLSTTTIWEELETTTKLIFQNPGLPVTVLVFGYIEMTDEVLISSCSMIVRRYFAWHGSVAGFLIASLGALVLPAHFVVEKASHYYSERSILSKSLVFLVISLFGILNWSGLFFDIAGAIEGHDYDGAKVEDYAKLSVWDQDLESAMTEEGEFRYDFGSGPIVYILFLSAVFMGTIVLEGVDTSIMAKVTPTALNDRFINSGLLATLVGTLGRVIADGMITFSALMDVHVLVDFVNATFIPLLVLTLCGLVLVNKFYKQLV